MLTPEQIESAIKPIEWLECYELLTLGRLTLGRCPFARFSIFENVGDEKSFRVIVNYEGGWHTDYFCAIDKAKEFAEKKYKEIIIRCFNVKQ